MADVAEDQLDDFAEGVAADTSAGGQKPGPSATATAAEVPVSPVTKILQSIFGSGKKNKPVVSKSGEAQPSPMPVPVPKDASPGVVRPAVSMPGGPLVTIVTRNEFYRDGFRRLLWIAFTQAIVIVGLLIAFISFVTTGKSQDRYFATTADGRIMQLAPLDQPGNMTTAALMSWVALATSEVMTFGYNDYQRRLQQSSRHFTHHGWETFTAALQASHIIDGMLANKEVLTASPRAAPILKQEGVINGKYRWIVQLQLQVSYDSTVGTSRKSNLNVTLVIERVPSLENPSGVGIEQWISTQG